VESVQEPYETKIVCVWQNTVSYVKQVVHIVTTVLCKGLIQGCRNILHSGPCWSARTTWKRNIGMFPL